MTAQPGTLHLDGEKLDDDDHAPCLFVDRDYTLQLKFENDDGTVIDVSTWDFHASIGVEGSPDFDFTVNKVDAANGRIDIVAARADVQETGEWEWDLSKVESGDHEPLLTGDAIIKGSVTDIA